MASQAFGTRRDDDRKHRQNRIDWRGGCCGAWAAIGIAAPGMPVGSPGMETGDRRDAFDVAFVTEPGRAEVFSRHD